MNNIISFLSTKFFNNPIVVPSIPQQIKIHPNKIIDESINNEIDINQTSYEILQLIDGKSDIEIISNKMLDKYPKNKKRVSNDVKQFLLMLNDRNIINLNVISKNIISGFLYKFIFELKNGISYRYDISISGFLNIYWEVFKIIIKKFGVFWAFINFILTLLIIFTTNNEMVTCEFILKTFIFFNIAYIALFTSLSLHESVHIHIYKNDVNNVHTGFFVTRRISIYFVRPISVEDSVRVKLLGGLIPGIIGLIGIYLSSFFSPSTQLYFYVFFSIYAIHLINLLPFWGDGRGILITLLNRKSR